MLINNFILNRIFYMFKSCISYIMYFVVLSTLFSCNTEHSDVIGVIDKISYNHIGRNYSKQLITYSYVFDYNKYSGVESFWLNRKKVWLEGDSIKIRVNKHNPKKSRIIGKLKKSEPVKVININ